MQLVLGVKRKLNKDILTGSGGRRRTRLDLID